MKSSSKRIIAIAWHLVLAIVQLFEAADGGHSAIVRALALFGAGEHNLRRVGFVLLFIAYDWLRSGDNAVHVVKCLKDLFTRRP